VKPSLFFSQGLIVATASLLLGACLAPGTKSVGPATVSSDTKTEPAAAPFAFTEDETTVDRAAPSPPMVPTSDIEEIVPWAIPADDFRLVYGEDFRSFLTSNTEASLILPAAGPLQVKFQPEWTSRGDATASLLSLWYPTLDGDVLRLIWRPQAGEAASTDSMTACDVAIQGTGGVLGDKRLSRSPVGSNVSLSVRPGELLVYLVFSSPVLNAALGPLPGTVPPCSEGMAELDGAVFSKFHEESQGDFYRKRVFPLGQFNLQAPPIENLESISPPRIPVPSGPLYRLIR